MATALSQFGRLENELTQRTEGTGLGLPLAKGLTELHGGTLEIESRPGAGTTVTCRFPKDRLLV